MLIAINSILSFHFDKAKRNYLCTLGSAHFSMFREMIVTRMGENRAK